MLSVDELKSIAQDYVKKTDERPIFVIMVAQHPERIAVAENGSELDFPDFGESEIVGFFYDLDLAVSAVRSNACDIWENGCFNSVFILLRRPGIYDYATPNCRLYFKWDDDVKGFIQAEEPPICSHIAL